MRVSNAGVRAMTVFLVRVASCDCCDTNYQHLIVGCPMPAVMPDARMEEVKLEREEERTRYNPGVYVMKKNVIARCGLLPTQQYIAVSFILLA